MECNAARPQGLNLKSIDLLSTCPQSKRTSRETNNQRMLMKLYLSKQVLEECLQSFDIFRQILQDPLQKSKLIRDVIKTIKLQVFNADDLIYSKGETAESIFMVLKGTVALCLPVPREDTQAQQIEYEFQEIDSFQEGMGFGEAEFVHGRKRSLAAQCRQDGTVIGCIGSLAFQEIIELYRQRVYYKKIEMFSRCTLLQSLKPHQLQFIINNAKPVHFSISKEIVSEGQIPKALYLITQGQVELNRQDRTSANSPPRRKNKQNDASEKVKGSRLVIGLLDEGCFLGDSELALGSAFTYTAVCKSEKVKAYVCNEKIIHSQVGTEWFEEVRKDYEGKFQCRESQLKVYKEAKDHIQQELDSLQGVHLTNTQQIIKRKILNRYVEKKPTLVGKLSPHQISLSIKRKQARIKAISNSDHLPNLSLLPTIISPTHPLKRNQRAFSPLLKRHLNNERKYSQPSQPLDLERSVTLKQTSVEQGQLSNGMRKRFSEARALKLEKVSPKKRSVQERKVRVTIFGNGGGQKLQQQSQLSAIQMRRLYQFISKLQRRVHANDH